MFGVQSDERVSLESGLGNILGVKGVGPPGLLSEFPCDVLEYTISKEAEAQAAHVIKVSFGALERLAAAQKSLSA